MRLGEIRLDKVTFCEVRLGKVTFYEVRLGEIRSGKKE